MAADHVRLFVALPVPEHVRVLVQAAVAPAREAAPELTWTRPDGWHVTLAFLGDVPASRVGEVERAVGGPVGGVGGPVGGVGGPVGSGGGSRGVGGPISCRLAGVGRFGRRALWLGVEDDPAGAIAGLGEQVQDALAAASLPVQRQEVRPHLTVARANRREADLTRAEREVARIGASWEAETVELVRSHVGSGPARYEPIAAWPLGPIS